MTSLPRWQRSLSLSISVTVLGVSPGLAEVSVDIGSAGIPSTIIMLGIGESPDIIPTVWRVHRGNALMRALNPDGEARQDGWPDIAAHASGAPLAAWAYNNGSEHDVAVSEWNGSAWTATEFVSSSIANELDPRVFVSADGTLHVVWWEAGAQERVMLASRAQGSSMWSPAVQVSPAGVPARRPSVLVGAGGTLQIAYERSVTVPGAGQEIVVATRVEPAGPFTDEVVATTQRSGPLTPILSDANGKRWVDWMEDDESFGCARWTGQSWEPSAIVPWTSSTWLGIEDMRRVVRRYVLSTE